MNPHLFVYGTLISRSRHPMAGKLAREATLIGSATLQGRLYRIAWYPGVIDSLDVEERVYGELYALADPHTSFAWLDAYEGLRPGREDNEYARVERFARLAAVGEVAAWVYIYQGDPSSLSHIADGRWRPPAK
jgi:gamma-glutamylcyclotransferase (GGCT)/AIG2-like uncharacterized protein YtfP